MIDRKKLAVIHILKKELQLSDEDYRDILFQFTGVRSAKDLTEESFQQLMKLFVRSKYYKINLNGLTLKQKLYIEHFFYELSWDIGHQLNFLKKYYRKASIEALTKREASKVIEGLKNILKRVS